MPKSHNGLFDRVTSFDNLYQAFCDARKGKRYALSVMQFQKDLEENLINIQNHLIWETWLPGRWREFVVLDPKRRLIHAPPFADRVVHHALVRVIAPLFEKKFINNSFACRPGKGFHQAAKLVQRFLQDTSRTHARAYILKADISKYFQSINHDRLIEIVGRTVRDPSVIRLCEVIVRQSGMGATGLPVGALTSQLFANVYLDTLDHYIKDGMGVGMYCRYMDDFVIVSDQKRALWQIYDATNQFIVSTLGLQFNPKTDIFPASQGVDFCGYRIWRTHILPRKRIVKRARRRLTSLARKCLVRPDMRLRMYQAETSFLGYMKHCSGATTVSNIQAQINNIINGDSKNGLGR